MKSIRYRQMAKYPRVEYDEAIADKPLEIVLSALLEGGNLGIERLTPDIITDDLTPATDIRTDRWELTLELTSAVEKNRRLHRTQAMHTEKAPENGTTAEKQTPNQ